jgi:hypothetical protein
MTRTAATLITIQAHESRIASLERELRDLHARLLQPPEASVWLSTMQVALLTGRSERAIRSWGRLIGRRDDRGAWQFERNRLRQFLIERHGVEKLPPALR